MNNLKRRILFSSLLAVLSLNLLFGILIFQHSEAAGAEDNPYRNIEKFTRVLSQVRENHVDRDKLSYESLIRNALRGMLASLDPHSEYMDPSKYTQLRADTEGEFGGVGIVVGMRDNYLTVIAPMADTPALRAGVLAGDRIIRIEERSARGLTFQEALELLRGQPGTDVDITIHRPSTGENRTIRVTRAVIKIDMVKDMAGGTNFDLGEDSVGYVRITQFGDMTSEDLRLALDRLLEQGMESLILDLRNNPGGLLDQAVEVAGMFLEEGQMVVYTKGQKPTSHTVRKAHDSDPLLDLPMAVLVNHGSASASEIVAGCLQDLKRAVVIGDTTFGKGSVQSILPQPDGSALRLTTAKYYTPSARIIDNQGISPDILVRISPEDQEALDYQRATGGLDSFTDLPEVTRERIRNTRDIALDRARNLLLAIRLHAERRGTGRTAVALD